MVYAGDNNNNIIALQPNPPLNTQPFAYSNCFVVNIDGPINFNATHSLQDDGSDLPLSDINTIRFFYNLGIEVSLNLIVISSYNIVFHRCHQTISRIFLSIQTFTS